MNYSNVLSHNKVASKQYQNKKLAEKSRIKGKTLKNKFLFVFSDML